MIRKRICKKTKSANISRNDCVKGDASSIWNLDFENAPKPSAKFAKLRSFNSLADGSSARYGNTISSSHEQGLISHHITQIRAASNSEAISSSGICDPKLGIRGKGNTVPYFFPCASVPV